MEKAQAKALGDPVKTGEELSKTQLKKRAEVALEQIDKSKEKAEELKEEADSLKPDVTKAEETLKTLMDVKAKSDAPDDSAEHENLMKSIEHAKEDVDEAQKAVADKQIAAVEQQSKVLQSQNLIENAKEQIKAKKEDEKEMKEIMMANSGLIAQSNKRADVVDAENAKAYINHVIEKGKEFEETHKTMQDQLEKEKIAERKAVKEAFEANPKNTQHEPSKAKQTKQKKQSGSDTESSSSEDESSDDEST